MSQSICRPLCSPVSQVPLYQRRDHSTKSCLPVFNPPNIVATDAEFWPFKKLSQMYLLRLVGIAKNIMLAIILTTEKNRSDTGS